MESSTRSSMEVVAQPWAKWHHDLQHSRREGSARNDHSEYLVPVSYQNMLHRTQIHACCIYIYIDIYICIDINRNIEFLVETNLPPATWLAWSIWGSPLKIRQCTENPPDAGFRPRIRAPIANQIVGQLLTGVVTSWFRCQGRECCWCQLWGSRPATTDADSRGHWSTESEGFLQMDHGLVMWKKHIWRIGSCNLTNKSNLPNKQDQTSNKAAT